MFWLGRFFDLGVLVDFASRELRQREVGLLFFVESSLQQVCRVAMAQLVRPSRQRSIARNLVVLDSLCGGQQSSIKCRHALVLVHDFRALFENAEDSGALLSLGCLTNRLEDLLKPVDLVFSFTVVLREGRLETNVEY